MGLQEYKGVEFEDEKYMPEAKVTEKGGLYGFLLTKGLVKNQHQANIVMLVAAALIALVAYSLFQTLSGAPSNAPELTPEDSYRAGNASEIDNDLRL